MPRSSIKVEGCVLSYDALTKAWEEINKPEPLANLTRVRQRNTGQNGVVIRGNVQRSYIKGKQVEGNSLEGTLTVVDINGGGDTYQNESSLLKYWELCS